MAHAYDEIAGAALGSRHMPRLPGRSQSMPGPTQPWSQHTVWAQKPEAHCSGLVHDSPRAWPIGVRVGVALGTGVGVAVIVEVAVGVAVTVAVFVG
jgi:hypothetical protein